MAASKTPAWLSRGQRCNVGYIGNATKLWKRGCICTGWGVGSFLFGPQGAGKSTIIQIVSEISQYCDVVQAYEGCAQMIEWMMKHAWQLLHLSSRIKILQHAERVAAKTDRNELIPQIVRMIGFFFAFLHQSQRHTIRSRTIVPTMKVKHRTTQKRQETSSWY